VSIFSSIGKAISGAAKTVSNVVSKVGGAIKKTVGVATTVSDLINTFYPNAFTLAISAAGHTIQSTANKVTGSIGQITGAAGQVGGILGNSLTAGIAVPQNGIGQFIQGLTSLISNNVTDSSGGVFDSITAWLKKAVQPILDAIDSGVSLLKTAADTVAETLGNLASAAITRIEDLASSVFAGVKDLAESAGGYLSDLYDSVKSGASAILDRITEVLSRTALTIERGIEDVFGLADGSLGKVASLISDLPGVLGAKLGELTGSLEDAIGKRLEGLPAGLWGQLSELWDKSTTEDRADMARVYSSIMYSGHSPPATREEALKFYEVAQPKSGAGLWVANIMIFLGTVIGQVNALAAPNLDALQQEAYKNHPTRVLDPVDLIAAARRGIYPDALADEHLQTYGYEPRARDALRELGMQTIPEGDSLSWWLRGLFSDGEFADAMRARGWHDQDIERFKQAAFFIPPVGDLVTMAVREAFTPDIAERFGQYQDFPPQFAEWAAKQGVSEEWARAYWAAHWGLPSVQMGFEMLHRRIISREDFDLLLRAQDVMPFWRDKIVAMSYSPLTRVDVRRMHQLGVLTKDQVRDAYLDLGYDTNNAQRLADFTEKLNAPATADDPAEATKLTRTSILAFFADGVIERDRALSLLQSLGISADESELYLSSSEMDQQRAERKDQIALVIDQARAGILTFNEAQDRLNGLGLETREIDQAITQLVRIQAGNTKLPSRADLDRMVKAGLISDAEYRDTMARLGYATKWADRFLTLAKKA